jgi:flagellar FliL protein
MAEQRDDIEITEDKGGKRTRWLIIVIAVLLVAVAALAALVLLDDDKDAEPAEAEEQAAVGKPAIYHAVDTPFVVNFSEQSNGAVRYMQVKMKVMARDRQVIDAFKLHTPALKHELLMLLYSQKYDDLQSSEGTRALQQACLDTINRVLKSESLENELEAVYFTSFIMQ